MKEEMFDDTSNDSPLEPSLADIQSKNPYATGFARAWYNNMSLKQAYRTLGLPFLSSKRQVEGAYFGRCGQYAPRLFGAGTKEEQDDRERSLTRVKVAYRFIRDFSLLYPSVARPKLVRSETTDYPVEQRRRAPRTVHSIYVGTDVTIGDGSAIRRAGDTADKSCRPQTSSGPVSATSDLSRQRRMTRAVTVCHAVEQRPWTPEAVQSRYPGHRVTRDSHVQTLVRRGALRRKTNE